MNFRAFVLVQDSSLHIMPPSLPTYSGHRTEVLTLRPLGAVPTMGWQSHTCHPWEVLWQDKEDVSGMR